MSISSLCISSKLFLHGFPIHFALIAILGLGVSSLSYSDDYYAINQEAAYPIMFLLGGVSADSDKVTLSAYDQNNLTSIDESAFPDFDPYQYERERNKPSSHESHQVKAASAWLLGTMLFSDKTEKISLKLGQTDNESIPHPCSTITAPSLVKNNPLMIQCFGQPSEAR